jgi:Phytanoyl-CoA dioxygenase (PhyH)
MSRSIRQAGLTSLGHRLDAVPAALGYLKSSLEICYQPEALRQRLAAEGYLYLPGLLDPEQVWQARQELCNQLMAEGALDPSFPAIDAVARPGLTMQFRPDLVSSSPTLQSLLYGGKMMDFYQTLLNGAVRHFDYTWLRAIAPGRGTYPHCDSVYMGRGTPYLYTSWTPLGDVPWEMGGLMILEQSDQIAAIKERYGRKDVDCYPYRRSASSRSTPKVWNGALTKNPVSLRRRYGGRWLTQEFQAGDVLIFGIFTVHGSLDNHSRQIRLSADSRYQLAAEPVDERWVGVSPIGHSAAAKQSGLPLGQLRN